jgi:hypothetical protein
MPHSYQPELWHELFVMLGSSAAALLGLLFVVLTIQLHAVKQDRDFRLRARNNAYHLLNVFAVSALALAPQPAVLFGIEVALVSLYGLRLPIGVTWYLYRQDKAIRVRKSFWIGAVVTIGLAYALGIAGGTALMTGSYWGLPLVATSCVVLSLPVVIPEFQHLRRPGTAANSGARSICASDCGCLLGVDVGRTEAFYPLLTSHQSGPRTAATRSHPRSRGSHARLRARSAAASRRARP